MCPEVWVYAVTCLVSKHLNVSCQREIKTFFLKSLCSTSPRLALKVHPCSGKGTQKYLKLLKTARGPNNSESHGDRLAQILVDIQKGNEESNSGENESEQETETGEDSEDESRGIDLMASDEEDEEEIESENEEDRTFLDDEVCENDPSFYRRFNVELDQGRRQEQRQRREEMADCEDVLFGEAQTSDNKVLSQLEEKLNAYIQELPVLGFNSGKYDLNASKEFLFPYLIKHQPIKFTVKRNNNHMCIKTDS